MYAAGPDPDSREAQMGRRGAGHTRNGASQGADRKQTALRRRAICSEFNKGPIFKGMSRRDSEVPLGQQQGKALTTPGLGGKREEVITSTQRESVSGREGHLAGARAFHKEIQNEQQQPGREKEINTTISLSLMSCQGSPLAKPNWQPGLWSPLIQSTKAGLPDTDQAGDRGRWGSGWGNGKDSA